MSTPAAISFRLFGKNYHIACEPKQHVALNQAIKMLQQHVKGVQESDPQASIDRVAVVAALNICHYAISNSDAPEHLAARLEQMVKQIEQTQQKSKQAGFA